MPYVPAGAGDDLDLLNGMLVENGLHVVIGGNAGLRHILSVPKSQRKGRRIMKQFRELLPILYQYGSPTWYRVDF